jgi:hypothetical protein
MLKHVHPILKLYAQLSNHRVIRIMNGRISGVPRNPLPTADARHFIVLTDAQIFIFYFFSYSKVFLFHNHEYTIEM